MDANVLETVVGFRPSYLKVLCLGAHKSQSETQGLGARRIEELGAGDADREVGGPVVDRTHVLPELDRAFALAVLPVGGQCVAEPRVRDAPFLLQHVAIPGILFEIRTCILKWFTFSLW